MSPFMRAASAKWPVAQASLQAASSSPQPQTVIHLHSFALFLSLFSFPLFPGYPPPTALRRHSLVFSLGRQPTRLLRPHPGLEQRHAGVKQNVINWVAKKRRSSVLVLSGVYRAGRFL